MAFQHISVSDFKLLCTQKTVNVVDIRDQASFDAGHIEGAFHLIESNSEAVLGVFDQADPLVVCCFHGNMSQGAADYFNRSGFDETYSLMGGYSAWVASL